MYVRQAEVAALGTEGQMLVVQPEEVQDRGLEVVDVDRGLDDVEAEIIGCAQGLTGFDSAASEPHRECLRVMVASHAPSEVGVGFDHRRAAELAAPDDQRVVEQATRFRSLISAAAALSV